MKDAQETLNGNGGSASVDKCLKLTGDLKNKTNEVKTIEKERNEAKTSIAKYQMEMNKKNNKIAELEAQNVKLNDFNDKMYEICKTTGIFKNLEEKNDIEVATQKEIYEQRKLNERSPRHGKKPKHAKEHSVTQCQKERKMLVL